MFGCDIGVIYLFSLIGELVKWLTRKIRHETEQPATSCEHDTIEAVRAHLESKGLTWDAQYLTYRGQHNRHIRDEELREAMKGFD